MPPLPLCYCCHIFLTYMYLKPDNTLLSSFYCQQLCCYYYLLLFSFTPIFIFSGVLNFILYFHVSIRSHFSSENLSLVYFLVTKSSCLKPFYFTLILKVIFIEHRFLGQELTSFWYVKSILVISGPPLFLLKGQLLVLLIF